MQQSEPQPWDEDKIRARMSELSYQSNNDYNAAIKLALEMQADWQTQLASATPSDEVPMTPATVQSLRTLQDLLTRYVLQYGFLRDEEITTAESMNALEDMLDSLSLQE